jgi:hypothetical protein
VESHLSVLLFENSAGGVSETAFHWLKRRINPHRSNRSRTTNNLVHKSVYGFIDNKRNRISHGEGIAVAEYGTILNLISLIISHEIDRRTS